MPLERFNTICQGIFYSKMTYCLQIIGNVWGNLNNDDTSRRYTAFTKEDNRKLQTLQNHVLRLKTNLPRLTPTTTLLSVSGDLSVQQLTAFHTLRSFTRCCTQASRSTWWRSYRLTPTWRGRRRPSSSIIQTSHSAGVPTSIEELPCTTSCPWIYATTWSQTCSRLQWSPGSRATFQPDQPNLKYYDRQ